LAIRNPPLVHQSTRSTALPRNSGNAAPIVSFVDEYSADLPAKILRAFTPSGTFEHGFSHRGETFGRLSAFALRYPIGWMTSSKRISPMTKSIPTLAAALLMTAIATPVLAQAAIQEPGAFAFYHPDADVLGGRPAYRSFDQSNAYYVDAVPMRDHRQLAPRHHRKAR
jgi:hypothetical protein